MDSEEVIGLIVFGTLVIEGRERDGRHYSAGNHVRDLGVGDLGRELLQQKRGLERIAVSPIDCDPPGRGKGARRSNRPRRCLAALVRLKKCGQFLFVQQLGQLGDIDRNPPRPVFGEQVGGCLNGKQNGPNRTV